jgi:hypothetical protein
LASALLNFDREWFLDGTGLAIYNSAYKIHVVACALELIKVGDFYNELSGVWIEARNQTGVVRLA